MILSFFYALGRVYDVHCNCLLDYSWPVVIGMMLLSLQYCGSPSVVNLLAQQCWVHNRLLPLKSINQGCVRTTCCNVSRIIVHTCIMVELLSSATEHTLYP